MGDGTAMKGSRPARGAPEAVRRDGRSAWARAHFRGFENILVASFTPDLADLDEAGIRRDVRQSIAHGFFSTMCTPAMLSPEEVKRFVAIAADEAGDAISVGLSLHGSSDAERLDILKAAERAGAQHALLGFPKDTSLTEQDYIDYALRYAEATDMGLYLYLSRQYEFGRFHASGIPYAVFDRLAPEPNIIALKAGSMDPATIFELFERYNEEMLIGSLSPAIMPLAVSTHGQQWSGAWTVETLQSPETPYAVDFFEQLRAGEVEAAMATYWQRIQPGFGMMVKLMGRFLSTGAHPWEHFKYYQFLSGGNGGRVRVDPDYPDLPRVTAKDMGYIRNSLARIGVATVASPDAMFEVGREQWAAGARPAGKV